MVHCSIFQTTLEGEKAPNVCQHVDCHMLVDIKMEDFHRKACLVAGGHMAHSMDVATFSTVAIKETVCIALSMAALHDLDIKFRNYMTAFNRKKI